MGGETSICGSGHVSSAPVNRTTAFLSPPLLLDPSRHLGTDREESLPPLEHFSVGNASASFQNLEANNKKQESYQDTHTLLIPDVDDRLNDNKVEEDGDVISADPHSLELVTNFLSRHYHTAVDAISETEIELTKKDVLSEKQKGDLEALKKQFDDLSKNPLELNVSDRLSFDQLKQYVGGRGGIARGWIRCIFSRNARRARTIQKAAEKGQPFKEIYKNNKLKHIHPKAALVLYLRGSLKRLQIGGLQSAQVKNLKKKMAEKYIDYTQKDKAFSTYSHRHANFSIKVPRKNVGVLEERNLAMVSTQVPASEIKALSSKYTDQVRGISSMNSKESQHATNLWKTEFKPAPGSEAKVSIASFRHGVLDAYGCKDDPAKRKIAGINKASELVIAAAGEMPDAVTKTADREWTIPMVSVSLQTAGLMGDTEMIEFQDDAWNALQEHGVQMNAPAPDGSSEPWILKPDCTRFFTGVNQLALSDGSKISVKNTRMGHWDSKFGKQNDASLLRLIDKAHAARTKILNDPLLNDDKHLTAQLIQELINQISSMRQDRSYQMLDDEPYKLPPRVLLLSHLIGSIPCFNCKSGKDRTAVADVEIKFLVISINKNIVRYGIKSDQKLVPDYGCVRSDEERRIFSSLHLHGGGLHVAYANTGLMGNKTNIGNYLPENLGNHTVQKVWGFSRLADGNK